MPSPPEFSHSLGQIWIVRFFYGQSVELQGYGYSIHTYGVKAESLDILGRTVRQMLLFVSIFNLIESLASPFSVADDNTISIVQYIAWTRDIMLMLCQKLISRKTPAVKAESLDILGRIVI